ncbi:Sensor protein ZraS [Fundidesulfovibrio magnetotacticus]|uniref:histidine kinase n=1 Tax=Fundidesulfovibrio magnetotacticus TaxID=2730080 RepID=A0A6V8LYR2_9BACT|nr:transporter substrate-binding domain-containing protein [Fundidesulfovibrio magnetotacticus]GFK93405.1 Sensor protein ZraS [Fundidesulfovibrio magnetotacticus]
MHHAALLLLAALLAVLPAAGPARAADPIPQAEVPGVSRPVIVGGDRDYPPYEFLDAKGQPAGYNVDLTRAIAEVMGLRVEFRLGAWNEMRTALNEGGVDILQGISYSEERLKEVDYAPPHTTVNHAIFAHRGAPPVDSLEGLRGTRVALHKGGIMHDTIRQMGFEHDLVFSDTPADALRLLASGRCDYAVTAMLPGMYIIRENHLDNLEVVARSVATVRYGHAVRKGDDLLLGRFSEGLAILDQTGKYEEIRQKWLGVLENRPIKWSEALRSISLVLAPMAALLLGSMIWTHTLRRRVAERTRSLSSALDQLRENQRQLLQADKMAALGTLVSGVAHEINNPNGLILLNLPMLKKVQTDTGRILEEYRDAHGDFTLGGIPYERMRRELPVMLEEMQEAAVRIKRIVNDLKDFARRDEGAGSELVDANDAARKALRLVEAALRKATRRFTASYAQDLPTVRGSSQRVEQVLVNLLLNACQALPSPDRAIRLETRAEDQGRAVALVVQDEGVGVDPQDLPHLTDPFFTTKRATGGTGLGLSVSAGIVKELGGSIRFESRPGQGTTVTVRLPAAPEEAE